jgi:hypothetical protein
LYQGTASAGPLKPNKICRALAAEVRSFALFESAKIDSLLKNAIKRTLYQGTVSAGPLKPNKICRALAPEVRSFALFESAKIDSSLKNAD